jgi:hypothetical protein
VWTGVAACLLLFGVALPFANAFRPWPDPVRGLFAVGAILVASAAAVFALRRRELLAPVSAWIVGLTVLSPVLSLATIRSANPYLNPKATAEVLARYMDRGYEEVLYRTWPGCFSYHAGRSVFETRKLDVVLDRVRSADKAVLVTARKYFERNRDALPGFEVVSEQWIIEQPYVVAVRPPPGERGGG